MTAFKAIGPFGIFKQEDILRATPVETSELAVESVHVPKSHIEDFKFHIVQKTIVQIALVVKSYDDVETHERFVDTTNERVTRRVIPLEEDAALEFFGFDKVSAPPKKQNEAITKERSVGINVRIWMRKHKDFLRKKAEYDEAAAGLTLQPTDPNYNAEFGKILKLQPNDAEMAEFPTLLPKILNAMSEKLSAHAKADEDFAVSLEPMWNKDDGDPVLEARKELLAEYMVNMFGPAGR